MSDKKYRFCIHVPGEFNNGLDSLVRGEGRWTMLMGHLLAQNGHDVTLVGLPACKAVPGCTTVSWSYLPYLQNQKFDFMIDSCWYREIAGRNCSIPAEAYVRCFWGIDHQYDTLRDEYDYRHWASYPTNEVGDKVKAAGKADYAVFLPIPMFRDAGTGNNFGKKRILWPIKTAFEFEGKWALAEYMFNLMLDLADKYNLVPTILFASELDHHNRLGKFIPSNVEKRLHEYSKAELFSGGVSHTNLLRMLSESCLMITNGDPPASPMYAEAVVNGCVPLVWGPSLFGVMPNKYDLDFNKQHTDTFDKDYCDRVVLVKTKQLLTDELFYSNVLESYRKEILPHSNEEAYKILMESFAYMLSTVVSEGNV